MIDWHSHVLPKLDDGSKSLEESLEMLRLLSQQGVGTVVATPHFYADDESVDSFLNRRERSFDMLKGHLDEAYPKVLKGAEVRYYSGISRLQKLPELCIEGSELLLLEMPFARWTELTVREIIQLSCSKSITLVLAHIERYLKFQDRAIVQRLLENGVLLQINASFVNERITRRKAISMLKKGEVRFIGSDAHNLTSRAPKIGTAFGIIEKKLSESFLRDADEYGKSLLKIY